MKKTFLLLTILLAGCAKKSVIGMALAEPPTPPNPLISGLLQPSASDVFNARCIRCHSGERAPKHIDLTSYKSVMTPTDRGSLVVSGDANKSLVYQAILGLSSGGQMPNQQEPLSWREIFAIRRWISSGATSTGFTERMQMVSMGGMESSK